MFEIESVLKVLNIAGEFAAQNGPVVLEVLEETALNLVGGLVGDGFEQVFADGCAVGGMSGEEANGGPIPSVVFDGSAGGAGSAEDGIEGGCIAALDLVADEFESTPVGDFVVGGGHDTDGELVIGPGVGS